MIFWHEQAQLWWPTDDHNPTTAYAWVKKYLPDADEVSRRCKQKRTLIQAGGHVGLWPLRLAQSFEKVHTFEVQPSLQECLEKNCAGKPNIEVHKVGLGSHASNIVNVRRSASAGSWRVDPMGDMITSLVTIDSLGIEDCDAIVLDIEGYEVAALMGGAYTIKACKPLIYVEELERSKKEIKSYMARIGYREVKRVHRDAIYVHV